MGLTTNTRGREMSRPDQDEELIVMGVGEPTCEKCMMELYPNAPDSICDECDLNTMKRGKKQEANKFLDDTIKRESLLPIEELLHRNTILNKK